MLLGNPSTALKPERLVACPLPNDFSEPRKPKDLAVCFSAGYKTIPGNGIPDLAWSNKDEINVEEKYKSKLPHWETISAHSYFNMDEVYKTKFIAKALLE